MRCTPASVSSFRTAAAHGRFSVAAPAHTLMGCERATAGVGSSSSYASSSRATLTTSAVTHFPRSTPPRFAANEWGTEARPAASSTKEAPFPPTLATTRPARRRPGRSASAQSAQSATAETTEAQTNVKATTTSSTAKDVSAAQQAAEAAPSDSTSTAAKPVAPSSAQKATALETKTNPENPEAGKEKKTILARIKGLWETFKYLFRFYWNGIKQIWKNREVVREMKKQIAAREAAGQGGIRWTEKATIELHRSDMLKLPLFAAICLILEEIIPLIVLYAPSLLPSTCVLPSQSLTLRAKEEQRRCEAVKRLAGNAEIRAIVDRIVEQSCPSSPVWLASSSVDDGNTVPGGHLQKLADLSSDALKDIADVFGLRRWGSASMVASRIDAHLRFLQADDALLQNAWRTRANSDEQSNEWLDICSSAEWLWRASGIRGLRSSAADEAAMEHNMESYLHLVQRCTPETTSVTRALLPLALYDGTEALLERLKRQASKEADKGLRQRTAEVVQNVVEEAKRSEGKAE